jgi:hypothetical protein
VYNFFNRYLLLLFFIVLLSSLQLHLLTSSFGFTISTNATNSTVLPGYLKCFINYTTSNCNDCPPICLSYNEKKILIDNKELAKNIDQVFEKSLRQISTVRSGLENNDTNTASIYLRSLLLKNQITIPELNLIYEVMNDVQKANSIVSLGKNIQSKLNILDSNKTSTPIAISIVNIISKSINLLVNSDNIISQIHGYTNLLNDLAEQKKWIEKIITNTIIGCEVSGITGCLVSSIFTTGVS